MQTNTNLRQFSVLYSLLLRLHFFSTSRAFLTDFIFQQHVHTKPNNGQRSPPDETKPFCPDFVYESLSVCQSGVVKSERSLIRTGFHQGRVAPAVVVTSWWPACRVSRRTPAYQINPTACPFMHPLRRDTTRAVYVYFSTAIVYLNSILIEDRCAPHTLPLIYSASPTRWKVLN